MSSVLSSFCSVTHVVLFKVNYNYIVCPNNAFKGIIEKNNLVPKNFRKYMFMGHTIIAPLPLILYAALAKIFVIGVGNKKKIIH